MKFTHDFFLICKWVDNGSLADLLDDFEKELFWNDPLLRIATQITQGMEYLHNRTYLDEEDGCMKKCILHRDLKPDNGKDLFLSSSI